MDSRYPQQNALRRGRISLSGRVYHVTTVTYQRRPLFGDVRIARQAIGEMRALHNEEAVFSLAYVLMPDHLHWLFQLRTMPLSRVMQHFKGRSSRNIDPQIHRPIWQDGFHDRAMRSDDETYHAARYIVANPLRAGLVTRIEDYPFWDAVWLDHPPNSPIPQL